MDPGWDHTENEYKHLIAHTSRMDQDMGKDMSIHDNVRIVSSSGCNVGNMGSGDGINSLNSEYTNYLSSVVLNSVNHIQVLLYDLIPTSLSTLCVYLSIIDNSIFNSLKILASTEDILCDIHSVIISSSGIIIVQFKSCLNNTTSNLNDLQQEILNLSDSYGDIHHIKKQLQTIIDCSKDPNSLNSKLSQIIEKFKCSLSEFGKIESCIKCVKSKIHEIIQTKNQLLTLTIIIATKYLDSFYFKIKCCCDNIDRIYSAICDVEFYTCRLKYWIYKFINLDISNNLLNRFLFTDKIIETDFDGICSNMKYLYCCICKISNICNSNCTCKCTCQCVTKCNRNFICLCICNSTDAKGSNGCCICICKKDKSNCKCICICICKKGEQCGCSGAQHNCKRCLVKIDLSTLRKDTWRILCHLRWIRCYIQIINKKCCYCSCCVNGRCDGSCCEPCQSITDYYKSIMSRMHWIELLFKQIGNKINQLITLKNILFPILIIPTKCEKCPDGCCKDINSFIDYIEKALRYYYLFGSRIEDIRSFVEYKLNYNKSKEIISILQKSIQPLSMINIEINNYLVDSTRNNNSVVQANKLLMSVYSSYNIFQCYVVINRLVQCEKKIDQILLLNINIFRCKCILGLERSNKIEIKQINVQKIIEEITSDNNQNDSLKLDKIRTLIENDTKDNHLCLCMVFKYILYPQITNLTYLMSVDLRGLSTISRKFSKYGLTTGFKENLSQFFIVCVELLYKVSMYILLKYKYTWVSGHGSHIKCFCMYSDDSNYSSFVSIILVLSSLIENISSTDTHNIRIAIDKVSSLYSQLESYDLNSINSSTKSNNLFEDIRFLSNFVGNMTSGLIFNSIKFLAYYLRSIITLLPTQTLKVILIYQYLFNITFSLNNFGYSIRNILKLSFDTIMSNFILIPELFLNLINDKSDCKCKNKICVRRIILLFSKMVNYKIIWVKKNILNSNGLYNIDKSSNCKELIKSIVKNNIRYSKVGISLVKQNCITSNSHVSKERISVTNVETRNWGYDRKYEHDVSTDKGFRRGDDCPNLLSDPRYTFSHISLFFPNYPYICIISKCNK